MHHYLYFVSVMFADHSDFYAEKWSNRPHLASSCGSYHVGNENEELQKIGRACKENLCACMYKKKKKITQKKENKSGYLQPAVSSVWRKPAVNGYRPKSSKKKKIVFISRSIK